MLCRLFSSSGKRGLLLLPYVGFSRQWFLLLQGTGSRALRLQQLQFGGLSHCGSRAIEHRFNSCGTQSWLLCVAYGIVPDQGLNLSLLEDSLPLSHQRSPGIYVIKYYICNILVSSLFFCMGQRLCKRNKRIYLSLAYVKQLANISSRFLS